MNKIIEFNLPKATQIGDTVPAWAKLVERWYQMDEMTFALSTLFFELKSKFKGLSSELGQIVLAVEGASNQSDLEFVKNKAQSPTKFVYTLPNVSLASVTQILNWQGTAMCVICQESERDKLLLETQKMTDFLGLNSILVYISQPTKDSFYKARVCFIGNWSF